ncbi:hypothetical protein MPSEU_000394700 [Mayamaea pseudoterrestris]|nr:hypothetical protein MPSEU_000394700 [Mayamaea pseudoterrestris]
MSATTSGSSTNNATLIPAVLTAAPPPWHSILILCSMITLFLWRLPSIQSIDQDATIATFTNIIFPSFLSLRQLAYIRLAIAASIWALSIQTILGPGWAQETTYRAGSKLVKAPNQLRGIKTMYPFTSVAWNLLGASFTLSGYIALQAAIQMESSSNEMKDLSGLSLSPWLLRSALILWEIAAPFTLLVATVIRYAIWPAVLKVKDSTANLKTFRNIMMHNLNVLFAMLEIALMGGVRVRLEDIAFAPLVGCMYVLFSWFMVNKWNESTKGPQYIYYFFDTTLGKAASIALVMLLVVLMAFYALFVSVEYIMQSMNGNVVAHLGFVVAVCSLSMRFYD